MNFVEFDQLLPKVLMHARNCPEPIAIDYLRRAARELCSVVKPWRQSVSVSVTTPEHIDMDAALDPTWQAEIVEFEQVTFDGAVLIPANLSDLDHAFPGWEASAETAPPQRYTQRAADSLTVVPRSPGQLVARVVLKPSSSAYELPDVIVRKYGEMIARGAAGEVLGLPATEYANPALGGVFRSEFQAALPTEARMVAKGQQRAPLRTRGAYF